MKVLKDKHGRISRIAIQISADKLKFNYKKYVALMHKLTDEFILMQLFEGDKVLQYGIDNDIYNEDEYLLFKHSKGTAFMKAMSYGFKKENGYKTQIEPAINVTTNDFHGWTFNTGHFSDVYLHVEMRNIIGFYTRDTLLVHNLYLHWVLNELEKRFDSFQVEKDYKPLHLDIPRLYSITKEISIEFDDYITRNKSKKINALTCDGITVMDYILKNIKYKYVHSQEDVYKCSMIYGKPYSQVKNYIDKVLD